MSYIPKQRRINRAKVLTRGIACSGVRNQLNVFNPLYRKLKNNNNLLAKSLSQQKQENQILFNQNVKLSERINTLELACNKRDAVISKVQKGSKDMLAMLVTLTNCASADILLCQEFMSSAKLDQRSTVVSPGWRQSLQRPFAKSPARGVVKPMVSGHTITRPTINLRRINAQHINGIANLSTIAEVSPNGAPSVSNPPVAESRTPVSVTVIAKRLSYGSRRARRLPERIPVALSRTDGEGERRLSRRASRLSGRHSKRSSRKLSGGRASRSYAERITSPRVTLNDVAKLLRNSQTINVRELGEDRTAEPSSGSSDDIAVGARGLVEFSESVREEDTSARRFPVVDALRNDDAAAREDPLEGPSWRYNDRCPSSSSDDDPDENCGRITCIVNAASGRDADAAPEPTLALPIVTDHPVESLLNESMEFTECVGRAPNPPADEGNAFPQPAAAPFTNRENFDATENLTGNFTQRFVTKQRGAAANENDVEDFTLLIRARRLMDTVRTDAIDNALPALDSPLVPRFPNAGEAGAPRVADKRRRKVFKLSSSDSSSDAECSDEGRVAKRPSSEAKDPSTAKVVLKKLVTQRRPTLPESAESGGSSTASSGCDANRPRRQKAPRNLKEPNLIKKLRRDA